MAFWSDLGKKISDTTQSVVEKTKTSTDTLRLNGLISDEERNVQRIYAEIGRKYMELHGADGDPDFAGLMQEYQTSKAKRPGCSPPEKTWFALRRRCSPANCSDPKRSAKSA